MYLGLIKRFHHQKAIFAVIIIFADALDDGVAGLPIEVLGRCIANADLEHNRPYLAFAQRILQMIEQPHGDLASAVLRGDAYRRQMRGVILVDHHKRKPDYLARRRHHPVTQGPRLI